MIGFLSPSGKVRMVGALPGDLKSGVDKVLYPTWGKNIKLVGNNIMLVGKNIKLVGKIIMLVGKNIMLVGKNIKLVWKFITIFDNLNHIDQSPRGPFEAKIATIIRFFPPRWGEQST